MCELVYKIILMEKKKKYSWPLEVPLPGKNTEIEIPIDPEEPIIPEESPDIIPDEGPFENPPDEMPEPGEGS